MTGPVEVMTHKDEGGVETVSNQGSTDLAQDQPFESDQRFSREVPSVMENAISSFTFELVRESGQLAQRDKADSISAHHIKKANDYLVSSSTRRWDTVQGILGGVIFGVGASAIFSMIVANAFSQLGVFLAMTKVILGAYFITAQMTR